MSPQAKSQLGVLFSFAIISLVVTFPLVLRMNDGIPFGGDGFQFIWNGWWFAKAVSTPGLSGWWTPYQYAPNGASLLTHDFGPLNAFFQAALSLFMSQFAAYNVILLGHYVLGAWGAYILAFYFTGNRPASVIAGVIYGFSIHHAMHLSQLGTVSSGFLPIGVYYLVKYTRDGGWRDGLFAVMTIIGAALVHWYNVAFIGIVFSGFFLIGQIKLSSDLSGKTKWIRALAPWILSVAILTPYLVELVREFSDSNTGSTIGIGGAYFLNPIWLLIPSPTHPVLGAIGSKFQSLIPGNMTEGVASLGIISALLGLLSWRDRTPTTRTWCLLGLVMFLLALGPVIWPTSIPGPFRLWSMIPGLNLIRIPARFVGPLTLCIAMSVAGWLAGSILVNKPQVWRKIFLWIVPALIIFETLTIPLTISGKEYQHPELQNLKSLYMDAAGSDEPPDLIVMFPLHLDRREFLLQQTLHEIPTVNGALSYPPNGAREFFMSFNWAPEMSADLGVDMIVYQPFAAKTRLDEKFSIPANATGRAAPWAGQDVEPLVFLRDVMQYEIIYQDDSLIVFLVPESG
jgi:hypothetical protein